MTFLIIYSHLAINLTRGRWGNRSLAELAFRDVLWNFNIDNRILIVIALVEWTRCIRYRILRKTARTIIIIIRRIVPLNTPKLIAVLTVFLGTGTQLSLPPTLSKLTPHHPRIPKILLVFILLRRRITVIHARACALRRVQGPPRPALMRVHLNCGAVATGTFEQGVCRGNVLWRQWVHFSDFEVWIACNIIPVHLLVNLSHVIGTL